MAWLKLPGWGWARIVNTLMNRLFYHINFIGSKLFPLGGI